MNSNEGQALLSRGTGKNIPEHLQGALLGKELEGEENVVIARVINAKR